MMKSLWGLICVTMMILIITREVESSLHRVGGGRYTWNPDVNFSDWASHERFYSGDWLYFGFNRTQHNVLQVNKSSYEQCIETGFIFNITRGGRDVFQLIEPKPYYFICGRGYCVKGMKLAIQVLPRPPPPPTLTGPASLASTVAHLIPSVAVTLTILSLAMLAPFVLF